MSQSSVEIIHRFVRAYNRRDRDAVAALFHPDITWHPVGGPLFGVDTMHGRDETLEFLFEGIPGGIANFRASVEDVSSLPDAQVLAAAHYTGRGVASGAEVEMDVTQIWRFDAGKIVFFGDFPTREQALEAAGLSE
jgi:ketosteroid isomerase-like protein